MYKMSAPREHTIELPAKPADRPSLPEVLRKQLLLGLKSEIRKSWRLALQEFRNETACLGDLFGMRIGRQTAATREDEVDYVQDFAKHG